MSTIPKPVPAIPGQQNLNRGLSVWVALDWLKAGWRDFSSIRMEASILYGLLVFILSLGIVFGLYLLRMDYVMFPALAGFTVIGPVLAIGLYEKSRRIQRNDPVTLKDMYFVHAQSKGQIWFVGVLLSLLILMWMRVAVLLYALFFGMHPFPGLAQITSTLFTTADGWALLLVGGIVGGLFAAFAFAISVFSFPILLNEKSDAFSAMGASIVLVSHNLPVMVAWGFIVMVLFALTVLTGFVGMIIVYPVLGHATWHAYLAIRGKPGTPVIGPAIPD
ncbi:hypothetical protein AB833_27925 [Chromatiales bacterium (ex Bugula neritina AB1)]|nr:hypothetical protein AB833_27925 [Chromatiales bacterium (ex Bugula neritina AB1)]